MHEGEWVPRKKELGLDLPQSIPGFLGSLAVLNQDSLNFLHEVSPSLETTERIVESSIVLERDVLIGKSVSERDKDFLIE